MSKSERLILVVLLLAILFYFLPACIASLRDHPQESAIWVLNLFLGGSLLGWVAALVWAVSAFTPAPAAAIAGQADPKRRPCPHRAEPILPAAKVSRFCGHDVVPGARVIDQ